MSKIEAWQRLDNSAIIFPVMVTKRRQNNFRMQITLEENVLRGGYGERITDYVQKHYPQIRVLNIALPDAYVEHGNVSLLRSELGIDSDSILERLREEFGDFS